MEDDQILIDQENQEKEDQALFLAEQKAVEEIVNESQIDNIKQGSVVDNPKPAKKNICTANTFQTSMKIPYDQILKKILNLEYFELVFEFSNYKSLIIRYLGTSCHKFKKCHLIAFKGYLS